MRLTLVFPRLKTFSGAENLLLQLSHFAAEAGHEVVVVTRKVDDACRPLFDPRVRVVTPPAWCRGLTGIHLVDSLLDTVLAPALTPKIPDEADVVCFLCPPTVPAMAWFRKRSSTPIAYYCLQPPRFAYDLMEETVQSNGFLGLFVPWVAKPYRWLDRRWAPRCDRFLAISEDYAQWCTELYDVEHIDLVYPGIDPSKADAANPTEARRQLGVDPDAPLVVTTNKLIARKNVDVFLRAMVEVVRRFPKARGVVVGDGPLKKVLLAERERLGLQEQVIFTGFVPRFEDVINFFAASDVYVFLEKKVPFGLTVLEAGACGRPVVAVRGGGTQDTLLDGQTGFLVGDDPLSSSEVADKICRLLEDDELRLRMGREGKLHAHGFAFEQTSARFLNLLESMVRGSS